MASPISPITSAATTGATSSGASTSLDNGVNEQVFLNLLLNAEQAIREGREKGTIRIRIGRKPDSVWIVFQDDGPGIAPENLEHIFDPFFTTKRPGRGTGLGLSICKTVLREHGGNIEAATAPDGGAVFTITLPVAAAGAGAAAK